MAAITNFSTRNFSSEQQAMLNHFHPQDAIAKAKVDINTIDLVIYEKFRINAMCEFPKRKIAHD